MFVLMFRSGEGPMGRGGRLEGFEQRGDGVDAPGDWKDDRRA